MRKSQARHAGSGDNYWCCMVRLLGIFDPHFLLSNVFIMIASMGALLLYTPAARLGRLLVSAALGFLLVFGFSPLGHSVRWLLETRFPSINVSAAKPDGIVVLSGAPERIVAAIELAQAYPTARLVFCGGAVISGGQTEAEAALQIFEKSGIARERVLWEGKSLTTAESARFATIMVKPQQGERWLLVTNALHMPRAVGAFRQAGFPVQAYPVGRRIEDAEVTEWSPGFRNGLRSFDVGMYEWIGLWGYWVSGRSSAFFPKP
jgi:uncharacterized SAM-binding protein YcdF (DUF218 family)